MEGMFAHTLCDRHETRLLIELAKQDPTLRYCRECKAMLPVDRFSQKNRRFYCLDHFRLLRRWHRTGTLEKHAVDFLRIKCLKDKKIFRQTCINLTINDVRQMVQTKFGESLDLSNIREWCIVPMNPMQVLSPCNALVVSAEHRKRLIDGWKDSYDESAYSAAVLKINVL